MAKKKMDVVNVETGEHALVEKPKRTRKKAEPKVETPVEARATIKVDPPERKVRYDLVPKGGEGDWITVDVLQSLPVGFYTAVMKQIVGAYFQEGSFDPYFGRLIIEMVVFSAFTSIDFGNNVDTYKDFRAAYCHCPVGVECDIWDIIPEEGKNFLAAVDFKVEQLCKMYFSPVELSQLMTAGREFIEKAESSLDTIEHTLQAFADSGNADGVSLQDAVDALKSAGKIRERDVAKSVLDFQIEKAKKEAEKQAERNKD